MSTFGHEHADQDDAVPSAGNRDSESGSDLEPLAETDAEALGLVPRAPHDVIDGVRRSCTEYKKAKPYYH